MWMVYMSDLSKKQKVFSCWNLAFQIEVVKKERKTLLDIFFLFLNAEHSYAVFIFSFLYIEIKNINFY